MPGVYTPDEATSYCMHGLPIEVFAVLVQDMDLYSSLCISWVHCWVLANVHDHLMHCSVFLWVLFAAQARPPALTKGRVCDYIMQDRGGGGGG